MGFHFDLESFNLCFAFCGPGGCEHEIEYQDVD